MSQTFPLVLELDAADGKSFVVCNQMFTKTDLMLEVAELQLCQRYILEKIIDKTKAYLFFLVSVYSNCFWPVQLFVGFSNPKTIIETLHLK